MNLEALRGLAQPDQRSCGPSTLVAARMLVDPEFASQVRSAPERFAREVLDLHRTVTRPTDARGTLQLPWPRALGTPPWAVARQLSTYAGPGLPAVTYGTTVVRFHDRAGLVARMQAATSAGRPVPFYVGNRWLPRHVVLAVEPTDSGLLVYNPARGTVGPMAASDFAAATLSLGSWTTPWFVVLPDEG